MRLKIKNIYLLHQSRKNLRNSKNLLDYEDDNNLAHKQADSGQKIKCNYKIFLQKTRDEWCQLLEGTDVCFAPVMSLEEAPGHPIILTETHLPRSKEWCSHLLHLV